MELSHSEEYIVPEIFIKRIGRAQLLGKLKNGSRVIIFSYVISFLWIASKVLTEPILVNPGDSIKKYQTKNIIKTILFGFWLNPSGIIWSIQSINIARKGGIDISELVKEQCLPEEARMKPLFGRKQSQ